MEKRKKKKLTGNLEEYNKLQTQIFKQFIDNVYNITNHITGSAS